MPQSDMATSKGLGKGLGALISMFDEDMEELKSHETSAKTIIEKSTTTKTAQSGNVPRGTLPSSGVTMTAGTINIDKLGAIEIDVNLIDNNMAQPRRTFDPDEMRELEQSILAHGVLQPILLNRVGTRYMIVAGERRWRASKAVGLRTIPALVRNYTPRQISEIALVENLIRSDLNEIETAQGIKRLMDNHSLTQDQVSTILTKSRSSISHSLRLLTLPNEVQELLQRKKISMGHAKILMTITDKARVISLANKCAQGMSVRELEVTTSGDNRKPSVAKTTKPQSLELKQMMRNISELLGTRTIIQGSESQGKLTIEYHTKSELNKILDTIKKGLLR